LPASAGTGRPAGEQGGNPRTVPQRLYKDQPIDLKEVDWVEGRDPADQAGPWMLGFVPQPSLRATRPRSFFRQVLSDACPLEGGAPDQGLLRHPHPREEHHRCGLPRASIDAVRVSSQCHPV